MPVSRINRVRCCSLLLAIGLLFGWPVCADAQIITEFPLPSSVNNIPVGTPRGIVVGSDDALWFTAGKIIGRITTAGAITAFSLPDAGGAPDAITAGPGDALWFTTTTGVGRITTGGVFTGFPFFNDDLVPEQGGITAGPDGALWFARDAGVGRITTSGTVTGFDTPNTA